MGKKHNKQRPATPQKKFTGDVILLLVSLFLLALIPRLSFVYVSRNATLTYDEADYDMLARNLALGNGYVYSDQKDQNVPVTFRPPGYPFFMSLLYRCFDGLGPYYYHSNKPAVFAMRIVQAFLGATVPLLVYFLALHLFSRRTAFIAGLIMALYTTFIFFTAALMTENLFIPTLLLALLLLLKTEGKHPIRFCVAGALVLGYAIHIRPELVYFLPFLLIWFYLSTRNKHQTLIRWALVAGIVVVMVTPWSVRNYRLLNQFVFLDVRTGYNLYIGYHDGADGSFSINAAKTLVKDLPQDRTGKWEMIRQTWGTEQAVKFIKEHPWRAIGLLPLKFLHFWDLDKREYLFAYSYGYIGHLPSVLLALVLGLVMLPFAFVVLGGIVGVTFTRPIPSGVWLFLLLILFYTTGYTLLFGEPRFHMPLTPLIAILAAQGLTLLPNLWRQWHSREPEKHESMKRRVLAAGMVMLFIIGMWSYGLFLCRDKIAAVFGPNGHQSKIEF